MQRRPRSIYAILSCLLAFVALPIRAELPLHTSNDVQVDESGWVRPIAGDPYLVLRAGEINPDTHPVLEITIEGRHVLNRHLYAEIFWAGELRGFSEEFKGYYLVPFSPNGEPLAVQLNFRDFLRALGDESKRIDLIRIDLNPSLMQTDFQCRIHVRWIDAESAASFSTTSLHPPYLSRFLMKPKVLSYVSQQLVSDIFHRITRDWLFLLLWVGSIAAISVLLWRWRKPPESAH
ncbi:MAG: hypothetical protein ABQ298_01275 [Puniceicoccaceae bacterium]